MPAPTREQVRRVAERIAREVGGSVTHHDSVAGEARSQSPASLEVSATPPATEPPTSPTQANTPTDQER